MRLFLAMFFAFAHTVAVACTDPVGEWHSVDEKGFTILIFDADGTGVFHPAEGDRADVTWKKIAAAPLQQTHVLKLTYSVEDQDDQVKLVLCTGNKISGQEAAGPGYYNFSYFKTQD